jgi:cytoskeleton protein RodZ
LILMAAEAGGDVRAGIGTRLRSARERKGFTILQAAEKLHVDAKILESLEAEDFAALGAPVYARGHLRHYAELIGEPPAELQELYSNSTRGAAQAQPDLTRISRARPTSDPGKLVAPAVIVLVAIGLIGTVWWLLTLSRAKSQAVQVQGQIEGGAGKAMVPGASATPESAVAAAGNGDATLAAPPKQTDTGGVGVQPRAKSPAPATVPPKQALAAGAAMPPKQAAAATLAATSVPHRKDSELTLKFSADSWAEVYDASGQRLFYDVGAAASAHTVKGPAPLRIVLGNASGVAVEFNGRPAPITSSVLPDGSAQFSINARGRAVRATRKADGG